jgi:hypothetical protein
MRVLVDQATPVPIRAYLIGHEVRTAAQQGWDTLKNGELLLAAETAGFEVLLTTNKNMRYQQNLAGRKIAVVVLGRQQWPGLQPYVRLVVEAVNAPPAGANTAAPAAQAPRAQPVAKAGSDTVELSQRVYRLHTQGQRVSQIASALNLSEAAVNSYLNITTKS